VREQFYQYIILFFNDISQEVYVGLLSIFCLGVVFLAVWKGIKKGLRYSVALLLIEYTFLLFCSTVIYRITDETKQYDFQPFWSYSRPDLLVENLMNVVAFFPVGFLLGISFKGIRWWQVLLTGVCLSVSIEILQFIFKKGFSELDDVMHNTLGCIIGFWLYSLARYVYERIGKRSVDFLVET
jgi:glycopeptide antibiotics resistance protein